ncbi:hypothetical protein ABIE45_000983 [Methylobacterium sp. OAE515]|uniref:hypothetical protein n=1 Tax=Methylobacterium sp. OAE515 TaxID=2817895 RepID=UPI001788F62B
MKRRAILSATVADNACGLHSQRLQIKRSEAMALLSTMVERIAEVEGVETAYASGIARYLREAGLLTQAGRGRGAAHMTSLDAARFLIGLNASATAKDAPEAVKVFEAITNNWETQSDVSGVCVKGETFLSAVVALLGLCADPSLREKIESADLEIEVQFIRPVAHAYIFISVTHWDDQVPDTRRIAKALYGDTMRLFKKGAPDRLDTCKISQRTLLVAADVIAN